MHSSAVQGSRYGTSFAFHADLAVRGALVSWTSQSKTHGKSFETRKEREDSYTTQEQTESNKKTCPTDFARFKRWWVVP